MDADESRGRVRPVVVGRAIPTVPRILVVALIAASIGLMAGWSLAGRPGPPPLPSTAPDEPATTTGLAPTIAPLVQTAVVDPTLRRAFAEHRVVDSWLLCRSAGTLTCESLVPVRLSPSSAFGASAGLSQLPTATRQPAGPRFALVAELPYAVGVKFLVVPQGGELVDPAEVTSDGAHYLDLGALPVGRYTIVAEAELGPPAGGLVEAISIDVVGP